MTISKYLQKNAAEQDTASNTTLSPNEPTESNSSSLSEPKPSVVTAEQTPENKPQKPLGKLLWESFCIILPPVLLLTAVGVVAYYILCPSKGEFHADCTDTLYWAKATYDSGKLINPDFSYACLLPFGGSLLMLLFLPLFGFSMTTNMMGMLVFFFLFTTSLCWMHRQMHWDSRRNCITAAAFLMLLSASKKLREIFWGHTIYYSLGILFLFFGLALLFRLQNLSAIRQTREVRMHTILTFIALFLFFILCCTDQITAITIFALPILAGLFLERVLDRKTPLLHRKNTRVLLLLLSLGIAIIAGMKLGNLWANGVAGAYADNYSNWTAQETWTEHFQKLPLAWMTLLGLEDIPDKKTNVRRKYHEPDPYHHRTDSGSAACCSDLLLRQVSGTVRQTDAYFTLGTLDSHRIDSRGLSLRCTFCGKLAAQSDRLHDFHCIYGIPTLGNYQNRKLCSGWRAFSACRWHVFCLLSACNVLLLPTNAEEVNVQYQLTNMLEKQGLTYGYATFWHANAITVISGEKLKVRNVSVNENGVQKATYQTDSRWYEDQPEQKKLFPAAEQRRISET